MGRTIHRIQRTGQSGRNGKQRQMSCSNAIFRQVTLTVSLAILVANFGTSIVTPGLDIIAEEFGVSIEVGILGISLYLIGFGMSSLCPRLIPAAGPLFAAPLSEEYGRNMLYIPFMFVFVVLQIGIARSPNIGAFLALRCLAGIAASPPATLGAGTITDVCHTSILMLIIGLATRS